MMDMASLPRHLQLKILQFIGTAADIINCERVSQTWCTMVRQLWSDAVAYISIPDDNAEVRGSTVSASKALEILESINGQLIGVKIRLSGCLNEDAVISLTNRFPALQSLSLVAPSCHPRPANVESFQALLDNPLFSAYGVLPQFKFLRELNLERTDFSLSKEQIEAMPTNFFLSLETLSFVDIRYEYGNFDNSLGIFIQPCKNLRKFGMRGWVGCAEDAIVRIFLVDINMLINRLNPSLKVLNLNGLYNGHVYFDDFINRFPYLEEAELCRNIACHPDRRSFHNVALRKLVLYSSQVDFADLRMIADAPFQLTYFEITNVLWARSYYKDEDVTYLMLKQKQLEVLKLNCGLDLDAVAHDFFDAVFMHPTLKMVHFFNIIFPVLPNRLQSQVDCHFTPAMVDCLPAKYAKGPLSLQFCDCYFTKQGIRELSLSLNPFALKYIQVTIEHK